ncbi:MAG TPA: xylanase [Opitutae bacterium]|nr:xylanase [Opitutaceae bacterium]HCR29297.1 xylanase [Opitutae bacterium]
MPDLLHPNKRGYELWAAGLNPVLERHFGTEEDETPKEVIALWPKGVPAPHDKSLVEKSEVGPRDGPGTVNRVTNVAEPSIKWYPAKGRRPRTTVLVCPGGGYNKLAWDLEGEEVAEWLNSIGISAAVLKYRVPKNREGALQDAQRALGMLRSNAEKWNLDPERIGVLGFSAGGHLSATLSNHWRKRAYPKMDSADDVSSRPDFTVLVYPAYIGTPDFETADDFSLDEEAPPAFIVQTQDDTKHFPSAIAYNNELLKRGIEVELHTFPTGGHGYGSRPSAYPVSGWKDLCGDWLLRR